ncbi:hypothetical protein C8R43DRAFT_1210124 [Mycena crocata]|nr:hypothetical protein C8R43DRAFT_1210124 [Mycena crocata]
MRHAIESEFTLEEWTSRIWRDDAVVLVCIAQLTEPEVQSPAGRPGELSVLAGECVGSVILRGPMPRKDYELAPESGAPAVGSDDVGTKWQLTALFVSGKYRRRGIAQMLIQAGKDYAVQNTVKGSASQLARPTKVRLRAGIHPDNLVVLSLYSSTGFVDAGCCTGYEAYQFNGDLSSWDLKLESLSDEMKDGVRESRTGISTFERAMRGAARSPIHPLHEIVGRKVAQGGDDLTDSRAEFWERIPNKSRFLAGLNFSRRRGKCHGQGPHGSMESSTSEFLKNSAGVVEEEETGNQWQCRINTHVCDTCQPNRRVSVSTSIVYAEVYAKVYAKLRPAEYTSFAILDLAWVVSCQDEDHHWCLLSPVSRSRVATSILH